MPVTTQFKKSSLAQLIFFRFTLVFVLLFIISFSFPHPWLPDPGRFTSPFFEAITKWFANKILHIHHPYTARLVSDSTGFYIHTLVLAIISFIASITWTFLDKKKRISSLWLYGFCLMVRYYLAIQLLAYGWNKIFKLQFYLPEPNTLFTTIGNTPHDLLFWTTMGVSRSYTIFTGVLELLAALFLFFRRTQLLGALLGFAMILHVVLINFSYDISVKLYSLFLLFLCCILIAPHFRSLMQFFWLDRPTVIRSKFIFAPGIKRWHKWIRAAVVVFLIAASLSGYIKAGNFNDDQQSRPFLHGAYEVSHFIKNGDTLAPLLSDSLRWKRVFIHRRGYFIVQFMNDNMQDYELEYDTAHHNLWINAPGDSVQTNFAYQLSNDSSMQLDGVFDDNRLQIMLKKIELGKLPLMQKDFHWTIDD